MTYTPTYINRSQTSDGADVTIVLVDDTGTYPNVTIQKSFRGKTVAQLTNAFLLPFARLDAAIAIQQAIIATADSLLDGIVARAWANNMPAAFAAFKAEVLANLAGSSIDHAAIEARILAQWAAYSVSGRLGNPSVTISFNAPVVPNTAEFVTVGVSN